MPACMTDQIGYSNHVYVAFMRLLQACDEKLRAELMEATVLPLRLAKAKAEKEDEEKRKAQESAYRYNIVAPASHVLSALDTHYAWQQLQN